MYGSVHCSTQVLVRDPYAIDETGLTEGEGAVTVQTPVFPHSAPNPHPQNTDTVLMVPPTGFFYNPQAATDNSFMQAPTVAKQQIQGQALKEHSAFHRMLVEEFGIRVHLALNDRLDTPDSVYPNNWFSTHSAQDGDEPTMVLYPMRHENRRLERIPETIRRLSQKYVKVVDFTEAENGAAPVFLEGTGVFVLDRVNKIAYLCESPRADPELAQKWCEQLGYELFDTGVAIDKRGEAVYHTNVVMGIGSSVAVVCLQAIANERKREQFKEKLGSTHAIIDITFDQMHSFCGNVIELWSPKKNCPVMVMSEAAYTNFTEDQLAVFEKHNVAVGHTPIPTIERYGGGGVRCCIAELY